MITEQLTLFKLGGKVESKIIKDYTLEQLIKTLNLNEISGNTKNLINELLADDYTASMTLKDPRVLKLYFNLIYKYPNIKGKAEMIDMIATKRYYEIEGGENSRLIIQLIDRYFDKVDKKDAEDYQEAIQAQNESKIIESLNDIPAMLLKVMPESQALSLIGNEEIYSTLLRLEQEVNETPSLYGQDGKGDEAIVYLHYFSGSSDWFITELNKKDNMAFGYVVLNGDIMNSEFGYISIDEIKSLDIELDFYFNKMTVKEATTKYHGE